MHDKTTDAPSYLGSLPDYLVLGHVTKDLLGEPGGAVPGGTVTYSATAAQRLGLQAAVVTARAPEDDVLLDAARAEGVWVFALPSARTTTFRNVYGEDGRRTQVMSAQARALRYDDVPPVWRRSPIVHLGPVARELPDTMPRQFPDCVLGITPQGWMRSWDGAGHVSHAAWPVPEALNELPDNAFLVVSTEDLGYDRRLLAYYTKLAPLVTVTQGSGEAFVCEYAQCTGVPAFSASVVDPTGAGDVFATSLFIRYTETSDLALSARFAHAAAAFAIEGQGTTGIAARARVEQRMNNIK